MPEARVLPSRLSCSGQGLQQLLGSLLSLLFPVINPRVQTKKYQHLYLVPFQPFLWVASLLC